MTPPPPVRTSSNALLEAHPGGGGVNSAKIKSWRRKGKKIVFTNGCFDLIHPGHVTLLKKAKALGDILVVGVNSDASVRRLKGAGRPILKLSERLAILTEFKSIDCLIPFDEDTPEKLVEAIRPDILVKGADWPADQIAGRQYAGRVARISLVKGLSTTQLISRIKRS